MSFAHALVRAPLHLIPKGTVLPVLSGALRGAKWTVGAGNHSCWLGHYDRNSQAVFARSIRPGDTVLDVGAHHGFFTMLAARLTGPTGQVFAVEPLWANTRVLRRHVAMNHMEDRVTVLEAAMSDRVGFGTMHVGDDDSGGSLYPLDGYEVIPRIALQVAVLTIDGLRANGTLPPIQFLKMDIEGAEGHALLGAEETLAHDRPTLLISMHQPEAFHDAYRVLARHRYGIASTARAPIGPGAEVVCHPY